jgi:hypothetical protein
LRRSDQTYNPIMKGTNPSRSRAPGQRKVMYYLHSTVAQGSGSDSARTSW